MILYNLTLNGAESPKAAPTEKLRFGWKLRDCLPAAFQEQYRIRITDESGTSVYDTGIVRSRKSIEIAAEGLVLEFERNYTLSVEAASNHGELAAGIMKFSTELRPDAEGWSSAKWIKPKKHLAGWAPYLRTKFEVKSGISSATLYACGLGAGEFYINGERTDDYYLDPPATNYEKTVLYRATDVTKLLKEGKNAIACLLGEGFYSQSRVWGVTGFVYGDVCALVKLKIRYKTGTEEVIVSDPETWKYQYGPISVNNVYAGEIYDARLEIPDFADPDGSEEGWESTVEDLTPKGRLTGCLMPPIRICGENPCLSVTCASGTNDGAWIFDLGVNCAGIYELRLPHSPKGAVYTVRTSEALNEYGNLDHRSTGAFATQCIQQDNYIAKGVPGEVFRPRFTYHGFRYVEITGIHDFSEGYGTMPKAEMIVGLPLSTELRETVTFESSNEDLNRLHKIMKNTYRSNYHGYPEDCPAREKCGWLGDAEVVVNWGLLNYDTKTAYEKYLEDIRTSREVYGVWQMIAPGKRGCGEASPLWGCAQVIIPYYLWKYYGDEAAIRNNHDLMKDWIEHELAKVRDKDSYLISDGLGDWAPPEGNDGPRRIPVVHSSTFMFYEICVKMAEIDRYFGFGDGSYYDGLAARIRRDIFANFYDAEKHSYGFWASNGVALELGCYPEGEHDALLQATLDLIEKDGYRMSTGIYGNKYLVPALFREGHGDEALRFLFNRDYMSFGSMMDQGGTSIWETLYIHFVEKDRSRAVDSYNHPMHGGFMYTYVTEMAGIQPIEAGFGKFRIAPKHVKGIDSLNLTYDSPYGKIGVKYERKPEGGFAYEIEVPVNTEAVLELEGREPFTVSSGNYGF